MALSRSPLRTPLAAAVLALVGAARAQDAPSVQTVQVTARSAADAAGVTGFATPLARTPIQADVIDTALLAGIGATSLSDLTRIELHAGPFPGKAATASVQRLQRCVSG